MTRAWLGWFNNEKEPESRNILGHKTEFGNGLVWDMSERVSMTSRFVTCTRHSKKGNTVHWPALF